MTISTISITIAGGVILGFIFESVKIPLPVPPLAGLIAAAACLAGSGSYGLIRELLSSR